MPFYFWLFEVFCDYYDQRNRPINFLFKTTFLFDEENFAFIRNRIGIQELTACVAYMPEDGLYVHALFKTDLSNLLGENFNINQVTFWIKSKITYFRVEAIGKMKLWDEKE